MMEEAAKMVLVLLWLKETTEVLPTLNILGFEQTISRAQLSCIVPETILLFHIKS